MRRGPRVGGSRQPEHAETMPSKKKNRHAALSDRKNYRPTDKEPFMNERQREYFRNKLLASKEDILSELGSRLATHPVIGTARARRTKSSCKDRQWQRLSADSQPIVSRIRFAVSTGRDPRRLRRRSEVKLTSERPVVLVTLETNEPFSVRFFPRKCHSGESQ